MFIRRFELKLPSSISQLIYIKHIINPFVLTYRIIIMNSSFTSVEMPTPKTSPPSVAEKMPRRLISSESKPQPYTKSKSIKVPKLPSINRSHSACQDLKPFERVYKQKDGFQSESSSSLSESSLVSTSLCDLTKLEKKVKRKLNMDEKAACCGGSSLNDVPDLNSPRAIDSWSDPYKPTCGTPSTLQDQTKQFIIETLHSPTPEIDVSLIERSLNMPKRRVYDILGVLEGIGWVKKSEKNKYAWINEVAVRMENARKRVLALENETKKIDDMILKAESCLTELFSDEPTTGEIAQIRNNLYLTEEDIGQTEDLTKNSFIAVRTNNPNLRIEIPETKEGYELILHSEGTPIEAYTLSPDGTFTSIAESAYTNDSNPNINNPYAFDPFFQEFLRTADTDYETTEYPYSGTFSNSYEDIYTPHNFSLLDLFDTGTSRISQTHV